MNESDALNELVRKFQELRLSAPIVTEVAMSPETLNSLIELSASFDSAFPRYRELGSNPYAGIPYFIDENLPYPVVRAKFSDGTEKIIGGPRDG